MKKIFLLIAIVAIFSSCAKMGILPDSVASASSTVNMYSQYYPTDFAYTNVGTGLLRRSPMGYDQSGVPLVDQTLEVWIKINGNVYAVAASIMRPPSSYEKFQTGGSWTIGIDGQSFYYYTVRPYSVQVEHDYYGRWMVYL